VTCGHGIAERRNRNAVAVVERYTPIEKICERSFTESLLWVVRGVGVPSQAEVESPAVGKRDLILGERAMMPKAITSGLLPLNY
jgi:hypothetical protein